MFAALVLSVLGATTASAGEMISLEEVPFWAHESGKWATEAVKNTELPKLAESPGKDPVSGNDIPYCAWILGAATGQPYGDSNVNAFADLTNYTKLVVVVTAGNPRFLLNRDKDDGQWNDDEAQCHLIDNTKGGWAAKYFSSQTTDEGTVWTVDLAQLVKDKSYAHLHAIKGANWQDVTVKSMMVEKKKAPVGWTSIINNGNMEGDDVSSFRARIYPDETLPVPNAEITDGVGKNGSRGIMVQATEKHAQAWDNQFFVRFNEALPAGTRYKISFDYKADAAAKVSTQAHAEPADYIHHEMLGDLNFTTDWQNYTSGEQTVTAQQSTDQKTFQTLTFNLNELAAANNYYFDNIDIQVFKLGTMAEFGSDAIKVDFGFDTNIADLVKATGKPRLIYPEGYATVTANGKQVNVYSVEAFADGRFYIFLEEGVSEGDNVVIAFKNPTDAAYRVKYTSGAVAGQNVNDFAEVEASHYEQEDDAYPYDFVTPIVIAAEPENGSFNLPNSIKEFKVTFDKKTDCANIQATLNGKRMTPTPAEGFAEQITFTREGTDDLPTGQYTINITKIYPEHRLGDDVFGDTTYVVNIGKVEYDPNDVVKDIIPVSYFNDCADNFVPEGYLLVRDNAEEKMPGENCGGSGARMFAFTAGGDFTRGLYMRTNYVEYGNILDHALALEAGKTYNISFNSCQWKSDGGKYMRFAILDEAENEVMYKVVENNPCVNEKKDAVNGSTVSSFNFVPETSGNYIMRWYVAKDNQGTPTGNDWSNGVILANVQVQYIPNITGIEYVQLLNTALENANKVVDDNTGERYAGDAFTNLTAAVQKYTAEKDGYTNPSAFENAAADLDALAKAMKDHRSNCDAYDTQIKKAIDVVRQNKDNKFAKTDLYTELTSIVDKYHGVSEWVNISDDPEVENWQLNYSYDVLTDDEALATATAELTGIANTTALLFTEGASDVSNTGVKVLVERLRLGAEALQNFLMTLGADKEVAAADADVVAALDALTDDDALAKRVQSRLTKELYTELSKPGNTLFEGTFDAETQEMVSPTYDMTVFVKNPNIYKQSASMDFSVVPGWTVPAGFKAPGLSCGWGGTQGTDQIAEDCMFQTWGAAYRAEQTIEGLPAGVYTIKMGFGERMGDGDNVGNLEGSFVYVKTSDTPAVEDGGEEELDVNFAATIPATHIGQAFPHKNAVIENITVVDGKLTIGVNGGPSSHTFFNDVQILLTAPAPGFDYAAALAGLVKLGDVNGDDAVDIEDVVGIVNYILNEPTDNFNEKAADVNADGKIDVDDVVAVINIILDSNTAAAPKFAKYLLQNGFKF